MCMSNHGWGHSILQLCLLLTILQTKVFTGLLIKMFNILTFEGKTLMNVNNYP